MGLNMGRELESRLAKVGFLKLSLQEMLSIAIKDDDTESVTMIEKLINNENKIHGTKRRSTAKPIVAAKATKKTVAKTTCKTRNRSAERQPAKKSYAVK
jgi:hypothetical protein